jgi:hypothetical protein
MRATKHDLSEVIEAASPSLLGPDLIAPTIRLRVALALLVVAVFAFAPGPVAAQDRRLLGRSGATPIASVGLATSYAPGRDPFDPRTGGGLDTATTFTTLLVPQFAICSAAVEATTRIWSERYGFHVVLRDEDRGFLLIRYASSPQTGTFELVYSYYQTSAGVRCRTTLFYYDASSRRLEPSAVTAIQNQYGIVALQRDLARAAQCH